MIFYRLCGIFEEVSYNTKQWLQKVIRGYSDAECWNLDLYTARYLLPRLKHLRKHHVGYVHRINSITTNEEWEAVLDDIIYAMDIIAAKYDDKSETADWDRVDKGCKLLGEYFYDLWD